MEVIKSSIYYNKHTGDISLPNINHYNNIMCSICKNNDYMCIHCRVCSLHDLCDNGLAQLTIQKQQWPTNYCRICEKNYYGYNTTTKTTEEWCNACFICNDCHKESKCTDKYKMINCDECYSETYHCKFCKICLKHECHGVNSWTVCGQYSGFMKVSNRRQNYSNICYMDRCSKCIRFIDNNKFDNIDSNHYTDAYYVINSLWMCYICSHFECGLCFYISNSVCSMCEKSSNRGYDHMDDRVCVDGIFGGGNICGICDEIMYAKDYPHNQRPSERGGHHGKPSWFLPAICSKCAPNDTYTLADIKRIRSRFPHINALPLIKQTFLPEIAYVIFEYYYEERHYLNGELD